MAEQIDLDDFWEGDLVLPWNGRKWSIPEPPATESERLRMMIFTREMSGDVEIYEMRKLMGQTWNDLMDAGIGWTRLLHMGRTALLYYTNPPETAENYWKLAQLATLIDLDALFAALEED
jgi:hypothetical protein